MTYENVVEKLKAKLVAIIAEHTKFFTDREVKAVTAAKNVARNLLNAINENDKVEFEKHIVKLSKDVPLNLRQSLVTLAALKQDIDSDIFTKLLENDFIQSVMGTKLFEAIVTDLINFTDLKFNKLIGTVGFKSQNLGAMLLNYGDSVNIKLNQCCNKKFAFSALRTAIEAGLDKDVVLKLIQNPTFKDIVTKDESVNLEKIVSLATDHAMENHINAENWRGLKLENEIYKALINLDNENFSAKTIDKNVLGNYSTGTNSNSEELESNPVLETQFKSTGTLTLQSNQEKDTEITESVNNDKNVLGNYSTGTNSNSEELESDPVLETQSKSTGTLRPQLNQEKDTEITIILKSVEKVKEDFPSFMWISSPFYDHTESKLMLASWKKSIKDHGCVSEKNHKSFTAALIANTFVFNYKNLFESTPAEDQFTKQNTKPKCIFNTSNDDEDENKYTTHSLKYSKKNKKFEFKINKAEEGGEGQCVASFVDDNGDMRLHVNKLEETANEVVMHNKYYKDFLDIYNDINVLVCQHEIELNEGATFS